MSIEKVPAVFTGQAWDKKVTVEIDHSDITMSELLDVFKGLALSLGFAEESWKEGILDMGSEYTEEMKGTTEPVTNEFRHIEMDEFERPFRKDSSNTELQLLEELFLSILSGEVYSINDESVKVEKKSKKKKSK
jgi:hypothetical protein